MGDTIVRSRDGTIQIWELDGARRVAGFSGEAAVTDLEVSPDGSFLVAGDEAGRVLILSLKGLPSGPLLVPAWRCAADSTGAVWCPACRTWHPRSAGASGELPCPTCGQPLRLTPFVIEVNWRAIA
jgi:WD40 repeat protein